MSPLDPLEACLPLASRPLREPDAAGDDAAFRAAARLRPGVSLRRATSPVRVVAARTAASAERSGEPPLDRRRTSDVVPL
ncbi:MAG TPA: hypothetical protein VFQ38_01160, partial [Longimicrobiales bacterium]|nr:hypothetical protein [Longimicrobiales bacterium]